MEGKTGTAVKNVLYCTLYTFFYRSQVFLELSCGVWTGRSISLVIHWRQINSVKFRFRHVFQNYTYSNPEKNGYASTSESDSSTTGGSTLFRRKDCNSRWTSSSCAIICNFSFLTESHSSFNSECDDDNSWISRVNLKFFFKHKQFKHPTLFTWI